jgi:hypothetical protein
MLALAFSPIFLIWLLAWLKRGNVVKPAFPLLVALLALGFCLVQLANKVVILDESGLNQGWPPFRTAIAFHEVARIHHIFVCNRYASVACLAISAVGDHKKIVLPMKSFSREKRRRPSGAH